MMRTSPALCLAATLAAAAPAAAAPPVAVGLSYAIYAHGFRAMLLDATIAYDGDRYRVTTSDHTVGFVGAFITTRVKSEAEGTLAGHVAHPSRYASAGYSRGADRQTEIDTRGDAPHVAVLTPPEPRRDPITPGQTVGTVDGLSALAAMLREVATTGHCGGSIRVFDGARLTDVVATDAGSVALPPSNRSPFSGTALRCDFTTQLVGGFLHNDNFVRSHEKQHGTAWIGPAAPGGMPVPLRVEFDTADHGPISIYLQSARS